MFINKCVIILPSNAQIVHLYDHSKKLVWALRKASKYLDIEWGKI